MKHRLEQLALGFFAVGGLAVILLALFFSARLIYLELR